MLMITNVFNKGRFGVFFCQKCCHVEAFAKENQDMLERQFDRFLVGRVRFGAPGRCRLTRNSSDQLALTTPKGSF